MIDTNSNKCHTCEGTGWAPDGNRNRGATADYCRDCYGSGICQDPSHHHRAGRQYGWWTK